MKINKNKNFAQKAYQTTKLDFQYTENQIKNMLSDMGIHKTRITNVNDDYSLEFFVKLKHAESARKIRIDIPFTTELKDTLKRRMQRKNVLFRIFYYHLKDRFVAVANGLKEFEEEFLPDIVVVIDGQERRLGDILVPNIKKQLKSSDKVVLSIK